MSQEEAKLGIPQLQGIKKYWGKTRSTQYSISVLQTSTHNQKVEQETLLLTKFSLSRRELIIVKG